MSILVTLKSVGRWLKARSRLRWPRQSWTAIGTIAALVMSGATLYLQFWPRDYVTATILRISANPVKVENLADALQITVGLALWNRGNHPAIIAGAHLIFDVCPDLQSARSDPTIHDTPPFLIPPGEVVLKTLEATVSPSIDRGLDLTDKFGQISGTSLSPSPKCSASVRARSQSVYVGVYVEAIQSDKEPGSSSGLGGLLQPVQTKRYAGLTYMWLKTIPVSVKPFTVIPAQHALNMGDYWYLPNSAASR
jgi:hypothetical protein